MKINERKIRQIIREESRALLGEAENPNYFSDEYDSQDEDPNFFDDESDYDSTLDGHNEEMDHRGMEELTAAYDDLINSGYTKQDILNFITKEL
jgi:hypothetical protein